MVTADSSAHTSSEQFRLCAVLLRELGMIRLLSVPGSIILSP